MVEVTDSEVVEVDDIVSEVAESAVDVEVALVVDEEVVGETISPRWYMFNLSPAPQVWDRSPGQGKLHSEIAVLTLPPFTVFPQ